MQTRIGDAYSNLRSVNGGSPQGSILGNLPFTITTGGFGREIIYGKAPLNDGIASVSRSDKAEVFPLDLSLARISGNRRAS